jgi:kynurenine formamidase
MTADSNGAGDRLPSYSELPVRPELPAKSAWGLWGDDDQLGTLNLLTDERTLKAARLIAKGKVIPLCLPLHEPRRPEGSRRGNLGHHIIETDYMPKGIDDPVARTLGRDDYVSELWLQGSSQWDALTHVIDTEHGDYNGVAASDVHGDEGAKLGADQWARRGIVGRGVLLDVARYLERQGRPIDPRGNYAITVEDLEETAAAQNVTVEVGDILLYRVGWTTHLVNADDEERARILGSGVSAASSPGLEVSDRMLEYLWNLHVAAIAADAMSVEQFPPPDRRDEFKMHKHWLPLWGMPLGEYWDLDLLGEDCAEDGQYAFLLVSVPLNVRGGVGSPPQAVAIK